LGVGRTLRLIRICHRAYSRATEAEVTTIVIDKVEPFADGMSVGDTGAHERVVGTAKGELDPADAADLGIVDLAKARRNARGMVEYGTDVFMPRRLPRARDGKQSQRWHRRVRRRPLPQPRPIAVGAVRGCA
jgi:hypothetical protein